MLVEPGVYAEQIDFLGKDLLLESSGGPGLTVLQGQDLAVTARLAGLSSDAVLRGFTVRFSNGSEGGVVCEGGAPRIEDNVFTGHLDAAVRCTGSSPLVTGNLFEENRGACVVIGVGSSPTLEGNHFFRNDHAAVSVLGGQALMRWNVLEDNDGPGAISVQFDGAVAVEDGLFESNRGSTGAAIEVISGSAHVRRSDFYYNDVNYYNSNGGAIYASGPSSAVVVENCFFYANRAQRGGAVAIIEGAQGTVRDCRMLMNFAFRRGGAIFVDNATALLERCVLRQNSTSNEAGFFPRGGALSVEGLSDVVLRQSEVSGNRSRDGAAAYLLSPGPCTLEGVTITGNLADAGGIVTAPSDGTPTLVHSILYGNAGVPITADSDTLVVAWSDVEGGWPGEGVIDADPLFVDGAAGDYRLSDGSPCVDTGSPAAPPVGLDASGAPRHIDGDLDLDVRIDLGAYERTHVRMTPSEPVAPGGAFLLAAEGEPGLLAICVLGAGPAEIFFHPWGALLLDPTQLLIPVLTVPSLPFSQSVPIASPYLGPSTTWFQTLVLDPISGAGNLSNRVALVVQ